MNHRSKIILISVLSVILGVVCLLTGHSLNKSVPVKGADPTPVPTGAAYDPTKPEGSEKNPFTILEIVPTYLNAQIGYLIDGQEPVKVYGPGGILESAQAGYSGAYDFLNRLSEFTVTGTRGELGGAGEGTGLSGGGSYGDTIYAFEDEKAKYPEVVEADWEIGDDKIARVTSYYTKANSSQISNTSLTKYELVKKNTTNQHDTSGFDGKVYSSGNTLTGFKSRSRGDSGDRYDRIRVDGDDYRWGTGESNNKSSLKRYRRDVKYKNNSSTRVDYYYFTADNNGDYYYYSSNSRDYMYFKDSGGDYVGTYSTSYYVYVMQSAGTRPSDTSKTYYLHNGAMSYADNERFFAGSLYLDTNVTIEGSTIDTLKSAMENYYTYTPYVEDAGSSQFVFADEMQSGVQYEAKGTTTRVGSYHTVTHEVRYDTGIQKYEYLRMLKSEATSLGWISSNWSGKGLDGKEYDQGTVTNFRLATEAEKNNPDITKYDKPTGFLLAASNDDKGSDNSRYKKLDAAENTKIVGTPVEWGTYKLVSASSEYVEKPAGWTGETYNLDYKYVSAATFNSSNGRYTIPSGTDTSKLYFLTFSTSGSGKKYSPVGSGYRLNGEEDESNRYFYQKNNNSTFSLVGGTTNYSGYANGETTGFWFWEDFEDNNYYLVTFDQNDSGSYYVSSETKYIKQNGSAISNQEINQIASMLYTREETYVKAEGTSGQYIKAADRYEIDSTGNGAYIYYNGHLYTKDATAEYVMYKSASGQSNANKGHYWIFNNEFYRKNPVGTYVAEYNFVEQSGGDYIYWLRPVDQEYVTPNTHITFYYWKGLSYADNLRYSNSASYREQVKGWVLWKLLDTRTETYYAKKQGAPGGPGEGTAIGEVTITHSNVFLKNVMYIGHQDNDPTKPLDIDRFDFAGWYTEPECINKFDFTNTVLRSNVTLYAKWIPKTEDGNVFVSPQYKKTYSVKFYTKASATTESYIVENFNSELDLSKVTYVPVYEKAVGDKKDYLFQGWSTTENGTVLEEIKYADGASAGQVKLYPVWKIMEVVDGKVMNVTNPAAKTEVSATYTVEFSVIKDGAAEAIKTLKVVENGYIKYEDGAAVSDKYLASKASYVPEAQSGKKFVGWYTKSDAVFTEDIPFDFSAPVTEDVTLYACFVEDDADVLKGIKYVVTYEENYGSVLDLLIDKDNQAVEAADSFAKTEYDAFKADRSLAEVKATVINKLPVLKGNVQYKASNYNVEVKTVLPSELNNLSGAELEELLSKADMIIISNSNNHTDYRDIFDLYANKKGGSDNFGTRNDLSFSVATAIFKKSMEEGSAPILLDKALLNGDNSLNTYRLFVMLQAMDANMFYDTFLKANATNVPESQLWKRIASDGKFNGNAYWNRDTVINALSLTNEEKEYFGIDQTANFSSGEYPISLTNHSFVYSGEMFKTGEEFTKNVIARNEFYTANMFEYFNGKKAAVDNKYAPADAVNYMVFGYEPEATLDETTSFLEIQPTPTFENMKFWYMYVKKFMPNYSGKLVIKCGNEDELYFYLGTAEEGNYKNTLTIEQMTSAEFVGKLCDLSGDYRMIYLGLKEMPSTLKNNSEFIAPFVSNGAGDYYYYFHVGNTRVINDDDYQGQLSLNGMDDFIDTYCYPGNDFTKVKCNAILDFCNRANLPVVLDSRFYSGSSINNKLVDNSSYLYQMLMYGRTTVDEAEQTGLKDLPTCFKYGDDSREEYLKELLNKPNLRIVYASSSDIPPEYTVSSTGVASGYLNPAHEAERVLTYNFYLQGDPEAVYDIRMFIDMNADGKHTEATEKLDSLVIYDNTESRYLSKYDTLEAGHHYTVKRSINDYVGVLPWKLEVFDKANPAVHYAITGMTAIKTTKRAEDGTWEREKLNILQICSGKQQSGGMWGGSSMGYTTVKLPSIKDITDALGSETDASGKKYADYTYDEFLAKLSTSQMNSIQSKMGTVTYKYWTFLASLIDFDVEVTRINDGSNTEGLQELYDEIAEDPLYLEKFNMLVIGFADCYNDIKDEATLRAIEDFIESGKSVLFTHDTTSLNNLKETTGNRRREYTDWGYHINRYFRNILGMDRFGSTLIYDHDRENHDEEMELKDKVYKAGSNQGTLVTATDGKLSGSPTKALVHGYTRWEVYKESTGSTNKTTTSASKLNDGQITRYPYVVGDIIDVAQTHSQYYQLDLESDDIVVWYCLSGSAYANYYNDATNYYYIYNKGNITYTGVGHDGNLDEDEMKLFVNTMVSAYMASADPTAPQIVNYDRTTGTDKVDYLYVDYDSVHPERAIGQGVEGTFVQDEAGAIITNTQTKEVNFKLQENSIVTNKLMTMYVYEATSDLAPYAYKTLPMEMEVSKYISQDDTVVVNAIPVFIVTDSGTSDHAYGDKNEYRYEPGQILAIDENKIQGSGSSCYVSVGGTASEGYFTVTYKSGTNGYYLSDATVSVYPQMGVNGDGTPKYSTSATVKGRVFMAPVVEAGEEYLFRAPIEGLINKDMVPYMLHVNLRYGKRQDKSKDGFKELSVVRRALFNLD